MSSKIEPGCLAIIVESVMGQSVGAIVQCKKIVGTHSVYGPVWRVTSTTPLVSEYGGVGDVDVPEKWLVKIQPGELDKVKKKELVTNDSD
jgi:hypothetical protein